MTKFPRYSWLILGLTAGILAGCRPVPADDTPLSAPVATSTATTTPSVATSTVSPSVKPIPAPTSSPAMPSDQTALPQNFDIAAPFVPQAPYQVWDAVHEETCEEAAMLTVAKYLRNESVTPHSAEQGLLDVLKWEEAHGFKIDVTAAEAVSILRDYFSVNARVVTEVTVERIKRELTQGHLIIIPAAGRLLGNPNFSGAGPIYHMLVIRGYTSTQFITNDPGTRKGEAYRYPYATIINAIHDWDHGRAEGGMTDAEMAQGAKVMIVITDTK